MKIKKHLGCLLLILGIIFSVRCSVFAEDTPKYNLPKDIKYYELYSEICNCRKVCDFEKGSTTGYGCSVDPCGTEWTGKPIEKKVKLIAKNGYELVENIDYKLEYEDNIDISTSDKPAKLYIIGIGNWTGKFMDSFNVTARHIGKCDMELEYEHVTYDGAEHKPKLLSVYDAKKDRYLKEGVDYIIKGYSSEPCIKIGYYHLSIQGIGDYFGETGQPFYIEPISIENAEISLKQTIYTYDGSPKKPSVLVKLGNKILKRDKDYYLEYEDNVDDGTAYVYVCGEGIYGGTVRFSFVILPYYSGMDSVYGDGAILTQNAVYGITDNENNEVEFCCPATPKISNVTIPDTIEFDGITYKVSSIGHKAFYKNPKIISLTIGNNVSSIESYAFYGCTKLSKINFGKSVSIIENSAFRKCPKLTSIILPKCIKKIDKYCFYGCKKLKNITIKSNTVVTVGKGAIKNISNKAVIRVPSKLLKKYRKEFKTNTGFKKTMKIIAK